jgi:inosine-uridine nucleoside N-ribohydrolase
MSSRQLRKLARQNGAKAAGTKSPEGIKKSSMNALRHGLTAKSLVLTNESQAQFDELLKHYVETYHPASIVELDLVHDMVAARWRLQPTRFLQTATLDLQMDKQEAETRKPSRTSISPLSWQ